jgi:cytidylate kinase
MVYSRSFEDHVARQVRRWEVMQRAAVDRSSPPCVAISRLPGAGGEEVGQRVADKLDYGLFGREIVEQIVRERGVEETLFGELDEHIRNGVRRWVSDAFRTGAITESDYIRHVARIVTTLGQRGSAVIVGRGAVYILPPERALRVRVIAPTPLRVERLAQLRGISHTEASHRLQEEDASRHEFVWHHFGVHPDDPMLYDLVVNTGTLGHDAAAAAIVDALRRRFAG